MSRVFVLGFLGRPVGCCGTVAVGIGIGVGVPVGFRYRVPL